jgi:xanthine dehydrogenase accessory factor
MLCRLFAMDNLDLTVIRALLEWRRAGRHALLATVTRTWGSSPRPVGSIMALADDGAVVGSVSGGCIEDDLIARYRGRLHESATGGKPTVVTYGVTADEAHRFGLPCGGTLELLIEHDPDAALLGTLVDALEEGRPMRRAISLDDGTATVSATDSPGEPEFVDGSFVNGFGPAYRMLLVGAGQLAEYLATMAKFSGFSVTLCDPRAEYRGAWAVPGVAITTQMPDDAVLAFRPDHRSCVVALAHDPKLDDLALLEALESNAFYVGAIGSRRNAEARRQRMVEHFGHSEASLARLRGPIGIFIGSKTPPEIAVSVMAEILAVKNGVTLPRETGVATAKDRREAVVP